MTRLTLGMYQRAGVASSSPLLQRYGYQLRSNEITSEPSGVLKQGGTDWAAGSTLVGRWCSSRLSDFRTTAMATAISNWTSSCSDIWMVPIRPADHLKDMGSCGVTLKPTTIEPAGVWHPRGFVGFSLPGLTSTVLTPCDRRKPFRDPLSPRQWGNQV